MAGSGNKPPVDLADALAAVLARHVQPDQALTVALSGGVDSAVLLDLAHRLQPQFGYRLAAVHVDHGLSPNAAGWAAFCTDVCAVRNIPLQVRAVAVDRNSGRGIEAAARSARYAVFAAVASGWLLTAHNRDDQVETVFLNLLRGAGPQGLGGMPARRMESSFGASRVQILRPLLDVARARIAAYARWRSLAWMEDESNLDTGLARNFLRREVLPRLGERFPGCGETIARSARWSAEAAHLIEVLAAQDHERWVDAQGRLDAKSLTVLDAARGKNLLRHWLKRQQASPPDATRLDEIVRQIVSAGPAARICIDLGGCALRRFRSAIMLTPLSPAAPLTPAIWDGAGHIVWGAGRIDMRRVRGDGIAAQSLAGRLVAIRPRQGGERLRLLPGAPRRRLKSLLQEAHIPPWERGTLPLLWSGDELAWVPMVGISAAFRCAPDDEGWLPTWVRGRDESASVQGCGDCA
jgi:tRNA(Ile)-lysidine synthase